MSSATMARWSMPLVLMALLLLREEGAQGGDEALRVFPSDIVAGLDLDHGEARVGGFHLVDRLRGVHVGARAAHRQDRAAHLAEELPHVDAELRPFAGLEQPLELVAKMQISF